MVVDSAGMIGGSLSHYRIESPLGQGGMGVVYRALDTKLNRPVAIKVLPPDAVADPARKARFRHEARAASALNHPNIVTIHDIDTADGIDFIVMEYVPGTSLDRMIPREGLPLAEVLHTRSRSLTPWRGPTRRESSTVISSPRTSWSPTSVA